MLSQAPEEFALLGPMNLSFSVDTHLAVAPIAGCYPKKQRHS
jgi:hypothetical protein